MNSGKRPGTGHVDLGYICCHSDIEVVKAI